MVLLIAILIQANGSYADYVQPFKDMETCKSFVGVYGPELANAGRPYAIGCFEILRPA